MKKDSSASASSAVESLIRALGRNDRRAIYRSYRSAFRLGSQVSGPIEAYLLDNDWSNLRHRGEMRYLSGMVGLLHDVDETACERIVRELLDRGCSAATRTRLMGILSVTEEDYRAYDLRGVEIRESSRLERSEEVRALLQDWLRPVPEQDLDHLERLYVVPYRDQAYSGSYMPVLYKVVLVWGAVGLKETQKTLYHEIGHHVCRHRFGFDLVQEEEAEAYAARLMAKAHPIWGRMTKWLGLFADE